MLATQAMARRSEDQARTALTLLAAETKSAGAFVELTFRNTGSTKLADFDEWDVVVQYYTAPSAYVITWLPYVATTIPSDNQWAIGGLYLSAATAVPEVYEPDILNPGEEIVMRIKLFPVVGPNTTNLATIAVTNGVGQSAFFVR